MATSVKLQTANPFPWLRRLRADRLSYRIQPEASRRILEVLGLRTAPRPHHRAAVLPQPTTSDPVAVLQGQLFKKSPREVVAFMREEVERASGDEAKRALKRHARGMAVDNWAKTVMSSPLLDLKSEQQLGENEFGVEITAGLQGIYAGRLWGMVIDQAEQGISFAVALTLLGSLSETILPETPAAFRYLVEETSRSLGAAPKFVLCHQIDRRRWKPGYRKITDVESVGRPLFWAGWSNARPRGISTLLALEAARRVDRTTLRFHLGRESDGLDDLSLVDHAERDLKRINRLFPFNPATTLYYLPFARP